MEQTWHLDRVSLRPEWSYLQTGQGESCHRARQSIWKEWLHTVVRIDEDATVDVVDAAAEVDGVVGSAIISRQTGHCCSSIACCAVAAAFSSLDAEGAKNGPSKLTPFSPSTCMTW